MLMFLWRTEVDSLERRRMRMEKTERTAVCSRTNKRHHLDIIILDFHEMAGSESINPDTAF